MSAGPANANTSRQTRLTDALGGKRDSNPFHFYRASSPREHAGFVFMLALSVGLFLLPIVLALICKLEEG